MIQLYISYEDSLEQFERVRRFEAFEGKIRD